MLFRRKHHIEPESPSTEKQIEAPSISLQAHKYSIQFDISPEISYLDDRLCCLISEFLPLFEGFPEGVWISRQASDEGMDFCKINFWAFAEEPDAIKEFSIWFQAFFRDERVLSLLERFVKHALEDAEEIEVSLVDWTRVPVTEEEVRATVNQELQTRTEPA